MTDQGPSSILPKWFLPLAILAVVWNLMGLAAFINDATLSEKALSEMTEPVQELYRNRPGWAVAAFGVAVLGGTAGSILLTLRRKQAVPVLIVSLIGVVAQNVSNVRSGAFDIFGAAAMTMSAVVFVIGLLLVVMALIGRQRGWLV